MILMKEFVSLITVAMEISKRHFLNASLRTWTLQMQTTTEKIELIGYLILGKIKLCNLKKVHFEKKDPKS